MVKGNKNIKKEIGKNKNVMLMDAANVACLVKVDEDFNIDKDYKLNFRDKKRKEMDFNELRLTADKNIIFLDTWKYSMQYVNWFIKILKAFYENNKIECEDLIFYKYEGKEELPCLIAYRNIGLILAPRLENE